MTSAWQVRAGRHGERDEEALNEGLAILGWRDVPDLAQYRTREDLRSELVRLYEGRSAYVVGNWTGQLWRFSHKMAEGDLVVMPLKSRKQCAIGEVAGPYRYRNEARLGFRHVRPVHWLRKDVEPSEFGDDLRGSMGSLLTVFQLARHNAPQRISEIAAHRQDPGWRHESTSVDLDATRADLWQAVDAGIDPVRLTVRELLAKWNFTRRTATSETTIQADLDERGIITRPSFTTARMDSVVELVTVAAEPDSGDDPSESVGPTTADDETGGFGDLDDLPVKWLVSAILPTDRELETVRIDSELSVAITLMLARNYSQLAVLDEHGNLEGAVSWESIGRARLTSPAATLRDATQKKVGLVDHDDDLFGHIDEIYHKGYVLVRGENRRTPIGIVTSEDFARQFGALARPFSLVEEAELRLRRQVMRALPEEEIAKCTPPWANGVPTFGGYCKLLSDPENFQLLGWQLDQETFLGSLKKVRAIRNELMHFSQDTLPPRDLEVIEGFVSMLRTVDGTP